MSSTTLTELDEIWKSIPEFNGRYSASTLGRICTNRFRRSGPRILSPALKSTSGYLQIGLQDNEGQRRFRFVHRLVLQTFTGPAPENKPFANHKNGDKQCNAISNLEWCSSSENMLHAFRVLKVRPHKGEGCPTHKLTNDNVNEIRRLHHHGMSRGTLAKRFMVRRETIWKITKRLRWNHIN